MFTGIIETKGKILNIKPGQDKYTLQVEVSDFLDDLKLGSSIAVDGVCLSVTKFLQNGFEVDVVMETISKTIISRYKPGTEVNLEKAMKISDRLEGHIVQGHVDGTAALISKDDSGGSVVLTFRLPENLITGVVPKGSIAINGISLTVADISGSNFSVAVIPLTLQITTLGDKNIGDPVNIETDIIGKYVLKLNKPEDENRSFKHYLY
ncbi:MAG: riboflavin synthase [bacterium]|nr:riboflavin synthase [bacterium]